MVVCIERVSTEKEWLLTVIVVTLLQHLAMMIVVCSCNAVCMYRNTGRSPGFIWHHWRREFKIVKWTLRILLLSTETSHVKKKKKLKILLFRFQTPKWQKRLCWSTSSKRALTLASLDMLLLLLWCKTDCIVDYDKVVNSF